MKTVVIVGLGNRMMQDEGIGVRIAEQLAAAPDLPACVEAIDLGVGGFLLLHVLEGRQSALIIDCARMGAAPGTLRRFLPGEARSLKVLPRVSLHEGDVLETLALAEALGMCPPNVALYGVEPDCMQPGTQLSATLASRINEYVGRILADVRSFDHA